MNCATCGNMLPQGAQACPYCGAPVNAYGQMGAYQQSYAQYQQGRYPTGYQTPSLYDQTARENGLMHTLSHLPRAFAESFTQPGETLRAMVERRDRLTGPIVTVLVLALSFLSGVVVMRGFIGVLYSFITALTGASMGSTTASMNQGITYIAGHIAPAVGGIAALCQLICMLVPTAVYMIYICLICRITFSWELALGFLAVTSMNTVATSLLSMVLALLSPWLALLPMAVSMAVSYTQAGNMLGLIIARPDAQVQRPRLCLPVISVALTLLLSGLAGWLLMGGVMQRVFSLLHHVGSLI